MAEDVRGENPGDIQVIAKAATILRLISPQSPTLKAADVAQALGMGRSTVIRYLSSLEAAGLLERLDDGSYELGPLQRQLGTLALHSFRVLDIADPWVRQLSEITNVTAVLSVWGGHSPVVARCIEPPAATVAISVRVGGTLDVASAQAIIFRAFDNGHSLQHQFDSYLPPAQLAGLEEQAQEVRRSGYSTSDRMAQGIRGCAVPILDGRGDVIATLALVGTVHSLASDPHAGSGRALMASARAVSRALGYHGEMPFSSLEDPED